MVAEHEHHRRHSNNRPKGHDSRVEPRQSKAKDPMLWFTFLLAAGTIALAVIAWLQWHTLEKTDQTLRDTLRANIASLRPIIWLTNDPSLPYWNNQQIAWDYKFTNYGKSPANRVRVQSFMSLAGAEFVKSDNGLPETIAPVPPEKHDSGTVLSSVGISEADFLALKAPSNGIRIKVTFQYVDSHDTPYVSEVCLYTLASSAIAYCESKID
jgi:hypothetical protein